MCTHRFCGDDGVKQAFIETDCRQLILIEFDQALAQRLERMLFAFTS